MKLDEFLAERRGFVVLLLASDLLLRISTEEEHETKYTRAVVPTKAIAFGADR
jgi:hypothetical protein